MSNVPTARTRKERIALKRIFKSFAALCFIALVMLSLNTTVFAAELAGDEVVDCNVTIMITDKSGIYTGKEIQVYFKDITETAEENIKITPSGSWSYGCVVQFTLPAPTTYNIQIDGLVDGFALVNIGTGEAIETSFAAYEGNLDFYWAIVSLNQDETEPEPTEEPTGNAITATDESSITAENEDAEQAYREFLEVVSFIETDDSWYNGFSALLNQYGEESINRNTYSQWYADYVQGGTTEEYFAMSSYEQFLWTETYTRLAHGVNSNWGFDHFYGDEISFRTSITDHVTRLMNGNNNEVVKEAYLKLMAWQYEYVKEHGVPFNFINNRNYIEEINAGPREEGTEPVVNQEPEQTVDDTDETLPATEEPAVEETEPSEVPAEEEKGLWSKTLSILADNALFILLLIVLGGALFVLVRIRKNKDIGEDNF